MTFQDLHGSILYIPSLKFKLLVENQSPQQSKNFNMMEEVNIPLFIFNIFSKPMVLFTEKAVHTVLLKMVLQKES
jgi:hypothetical protein